jgi:hypothetical protein
MSSLHRQSLATDSGAQMRRGEKNSTVFSTTGRRRAPSSQGDGEGGANALGDCVETDRRAILIGLSDLSFVGGGKMKIIPLVLATILMFAGGAQAACVWNGRGGALEDLHFVDLDSGAHNCTLRAMRLHGNDAWTALGRCNEHANWSNLNECKPKVCEYFRHTEYRPACPGGPRVH